MSFCGVEKTQQAGNFHHIMVVRMPLKGLGGARRARMGWLK